jgi:ABC-type lipoprotein release transport system permease subunit
VVFVPVSAIVAASIVLLAWCVVAPTVRTLAREGAARAREEERAELGAHLHDVVLQELSIVERVHEIGLLRAIGLDRTEVRSMVRAEAVFIAVYGTVVGLVLGIVFVWAMFATATPGSDLDLDLAIPVWQLAVVAAFAVVASVLAAILPSIQATRVDALRAISTL